MISAISRFKCCHKTGILTLKNDDENRGKKGNMHKAVLRAKKGKKSQKSGNQVIYIRDDITFGVKGPLFLR